MPDDRLKPALRAVLRCHALGDASPYTLRFAADGRGGGCFGAMQTDLARGDPQAQQVFRDALSAALMPAAIVAGLVRRLSQPGTAFVLSADEKTKIDAALAGASPLIDALDEARFAALLHGLDTCLAAAEAFGRTVSAEATLLFAAWLRVCIDPAPLLAWLSRNQQTGSEGPSPRHVDAGSAQAFLRASEHGGRHPDDTARMLACVEAHRALLPA